MAGRHFTNMRIADFWRRRISIHKQNSFFEHAPSRPTVAAITFAVFMSLTLASWWVVKVLQERNANDRFNEVLTDATAEIKHHFSGYEQVLKGGLGLLRAADSVSKDEWRTYVDALRIDD